MVLGFGLKMASNIAQVRATSVGRGAKGIGVHTTISEHLGSVDMLIIESLYRILIMIIASDDLIPHTASRGKHTHTQTDPVSWS